MASTGRADLDAGNDQAGAEGKDQAEAEAAEAGAEARPLIIDWMPSAMVVDFPAPLPGFPAPLRTTMIELPKELTAPYANLDQVSFTVRFLHARN